MSVTVNNGTPVTNASATDINWQSLFAIGAISSTFGDPGAGEVANIRGVAKVLVWQDLIDRGWTT